MKKLFTYFERISATLLVGFLISLGISTVIASYTPSGTPGDPYTLITPNFNSLLIGSGTDPRSAGDLKVTGDTVTIGNMVADAWNSYSGAGVTIADDLTVEGNLNFAGTLKTDKIDNYTSSSSVDISAPVTATTFGDIYYKVSTANNACNASGADCPPGSVVGFYFASAPCTAGDYLLACNGYLTSTSTTVDYKGTYVVKKTSSGVDTYYCKAFGSTNSIKSAAICYSPTDKQGTNTSTF